MQSPRESNRALNRAEYAARHTRLASRPTMVFVELTQNCNLACKMCRTPTAYDPAKDMSAAVFARVRDELFPYACLVDLHGYGESTILRTFADRLRDARQDGIRLRLVTNAHAMTDALWHLFFEGDHIVAVSFDSADPEMFARLGRGDFPRVLRNVRRGAEIRRQANRGLLYFNVVLNSFTLEGLPAIVRLAAEIGLPRVLTYPIFCSTSHPAHLSHAVARIPGVLNEASAIARAVGVDLRLGASLHESLRVDYGLPTTCANPWTNALIDYQGRVGFCHHLLASPELTLGSLLDSTFEEIWNGPAFVALREEHVRAEQRRALSPKYDKCTWCYENRYADGITTDDDEGRDRSVSVMTGLPLYAMRDGRPVLVSANPRSGHGTQA